ncbi:two component transcriptional regulator, LuxR family [Actinosynnema pretiosum]|nr:two component transcriptional regulator, LuxR family [Actinosynnema pretiosum]
MSRDEVDPMSPDPMSPAPMSPALTSPDPTGTAPAPPPPIGVVIADDQALLRGSFEVLVGSAPDLRVLGTADDGERAVAVCAATGPDVVLMDVRMPNVDGIAATARICAAQPDVRVLILTTFDLDEYVYAALRAGASGFLLKDTPPADLLAAIRVVASGEALLSPSVTRRLITEFAARPAARPLPALDSVTAREREVLRLVAEGLSNTEITEALHVSRGTLKTHVGRLLHKLGARDRAQLVIAAYESGLVTPGERAEPLPGALPGRGSGWRS